MLKNPVSQLHPDDESGVAFELLQVVQRLATVHAEHSGLQAIQDPEAVSGPVL